MTGECGDWKRANNQKFGRSHSPPLSTAADSVKLIMTKFQEEIQNKWITKIKRNPKSTGPNLGKERTDSFLPSAADHSAKQMILMKKRG